MCASDAAAHNPQLSQEAAYALAYFALYLGYLFLRLENELLHWLSLVAVPTVLLILMRRWKSSTVSVSSVFSSVGLRRSNLAHGMLGAFLVGLALCLVQLLGSRSSQAIYETFTSGRFVYLLPLSFGLMLLTAGFTEEFFFR